ncbi:MAG: hypothetical protein F4Z77_02330 [Dehalococcoidia bacterium]|nr:hypothetical protein [Dehalococcoidia bacterium]MYA53719.1 hypothetical protein [Dehalococcoidia bacterium]
MPGRGRGRPRHPDVLTPAEQRVLEELRRGGTNAEIAVRLGRSPETVRTHLASMLAKLELADRYELAAWRPGRERRPLLGLMALPPALAFVRSPLIWAGVGLGGLAILAVVVLLLVFFLGGAAEPSGVPSGLTGAAMVATGDSHTCALLETREVVCWGLNDEGQTDAPAGRYRWLSAGQDRTCAVTDAGEVLCWGSTEFVSCRPSSPGSDVIYCRSAHVQVVGIAGATYRSVSVSDTDTIPGSGQDSFRRRGLICAVRETGEIDCWGSHTVEGLEAPSGSYRSVSAGSVYLCAVRDTGKVDCWWANGAGRMKSVPPGTYDSISVGGAHICGIRDTGELLCWGDLFDGRLDVPPETYRSVSAGAGHACAVRDTGEIDCWGDNQHGQAAPPAGKYRTVGAGGGHTCAVREEGAVACWGKNDQGQGSVP